MAKSLQDYAKNAISLLGHAYVAATTFGDSTDIRHMALKAQRDGELTQPIQISEIVQEAKNKIVIMPLHMKFIQNGGFPYNYSNIFSR